MQKRQEFSLQTIQMSHFMREDPCDRPTRLLDDDDEVIDGNKAITIFSFFCVFCFVYLDNILVQFLS